MSKKDTFKIRPAGRHILTIGRELIHDKYAAIVELVKNAYDADSNEVKIMFIIPDDRSTLSIIVTDDGHGMTRDTVINQWLVPSTDDKLKRKISPRKKRTMQGRKGVGRYAASILGDDLFLETVSKGKKTTVYLEWVQFECANYLEDVEILVETKNTDEADGTKLTIASGKDQIKEWDRKQSKNLEYELRKLTSPVSSDILGSDDEFFMYLNYIGFWEEAQENTSKKITPFPIFDLFDYRIRGEIKENGKGLLIYSNQKARNTITENIEVDLERKTGCGLLKFDIRVYDRDPQAIEQLIGRGLTDSKGSYLGKLQAKQLLNKYNGISVFRNGFRIRPLGDPNYDWLELNKSRVQNPSMNIGSDQVIGHIHIQSEEISGLEEKSARDGLKSNYSFSQLICISQSRVINELEKRRYSYRRKTGLSRSALKVEKEFEKLFSFDEIKRSITKALKEEGVNQKATEKIINLIDSKESKDSASIEKIRQAVGVYQGQATLGKIINVVLHEGRRPLTFFSNEIRNLLFWADQIDDDCASSELEEINKISNKSILHSEMLVALFKRIDPLATGKRIKKNRFNLYEAIENSIQVFNEKLIDSNILSEIECPKNLYFTGWTQDIYAIITNLVDNSIFWINEKNSLIRKINIIVTTNNGEFDYLDYKDTGPGIEPFLIKDESIFEPDFSTKDGGTGIGLAIAGEAASRNGLDFKAFEAETGVYFRLQRKQEDE